MKKVLLVDYDENHLRELKRILEGFEAIIEETHNGKEGLEKIKGGNYALIIASTIIPGLNGFELTRKLRIELGKTRLPVILVSSVYKGPRYKYEALHVYGADHFFEFPLNDKEFIGVLKKYLPEKAPTTTMKMETLYAKPFEGSEEEPEVLITTDELFGDILQEVEKGIVQERTKEKRKEEKTEEKEVREEVAEKVKEDKDLKPIEEEVEEVEEMEELEEIREEPPGKEESGPEFTPEDILKEILEPTREEKKKSESRGDDLIEKILEETLSGLGKKQKKTQETPEEEIPEVQFAAAEEEKEEKPEEEKVGEAPPEEPKVEVKEEEVPEGPEEIPEEEPFGPLEEPYVLGEYILLEKISTGGMAEVYKAKKKGVKGFEKIVALKKILPHLAEDEEFIEMFIDEAKVASKLNHPNIAQIYDLGKINSSYFIAMEYVLGKDLKSILRKIKKEKKPLPPIEISSYIVMKIAEALDYAHRKVDENGRPLNIVHRDVSPQNILISYEGEVKLVDFGVAKASIKAHQTIAGSLKGKLLYMSPEQARGENIDGRSDIFSLGAVFYELVTGEKAFMAHSEAEVLEKVKKGSFKPPRSIRPEIPVEVERIIIKAMEPNPDQRYQRASEMRNDIEKFLLSYKGYIPSARDVAEFMYELFGDEIKKAGIDVQILKSPLRKTQREKTVEVEREGEEKGVKAPSFGLQGTEEGRRRSRILPIILLGLLALLIAGGIFFMMKHRAKPLNPSPPAGQETAQPLPPAPVAGQEKPAETPSPEAGQVSEPAKPQQTSTPTSPPAQPAVSVQKKQTKKPPSPKPSPAKTQKSPAAKPQAQPKPAPKSPKTSSQVKVPKPSTTSSPQEVKTSPKPQTPPPTKPQSQTPPPQKEKEQKNQPKPKPAETAAKPVPQATPKTPAPKIKEGDVVPYSLLDSRPRPKKVVSPIRPRVPNLSGAVFLSVLVGPDGKVEKVKVIRGIHAIYDEAAVKAVQKWRFTPPVKEGKKVRTWTTVRIKF